MHKERLSTSKKFPERKAQFLSNIVLKTAENHIHTLV